MITNRHKLNQHYKQVKISYDQSHEALWTFMSQHNRVPCFNSQIVSELTHHHLEIEKSGGLIETDSGLHSIRYSVAASDTPDVFNLGGQLTLIKTLAQSHQREALESYAVKALNVLIQRTFRFKIPSLITISLLQGQALGAGLEAALTSDVIIAERKSILGFPEIMFNLFPGMGAYSLLARKVGTKIADEMILGGRLYTAEECFNLGLVDVLVDDGEGVPAVYDWIEKNNRTSNGYLAIQKAKNRFHPITRDELLDITYVWLDAALNLTERDFKVMDRFIRSQEKRYQQDATAVEDIAFVTNVLPMRQSA